MNRSLEKLRLVADANLFNLAGNPYPGRGIVVGLDESGENLVQVYWIMGRSENSRNRVFKSEGGRLYTEAADPAKVKDPSLIIYNAMCEAETPASERVAVVSNGVQTDAVADSLADGDGFLSGFEFFSYEPDAPNFTPRITAACGWSRDDEPYIAMSMLRKSLWSGACDVHLYGLPDIGPGFGYCLTTYSGDGDPLPSFQGEPYLVPLRGEQWQIERAFWATLDSANRVSLAVKFIPRDGSPSVLTFTNKYSKVAA